MHACITAAVVPTRALVDEGTLPCLLVLLIRLQQPQRSAQLIRGGAERRLNNWHLHRMNDLLSTVSLMRSCFRLGCQRSHALV